MFFVVTTGRSGSQSIAQMLSQHPLCLCLHEPHLVLIKLAAERCYGKISDDELRAYLLPPSKLFPNRVGLKLYGEADQKLSFFIPLLADLGDVAKFIWLIRDARDVVASCYSRGWYSGGTMDHMRKVWERHRLCGDLCGDVSTEEWTGMSAFEKCCWYWNYTNRRIAIDLGTLAEEQWMMLKLEGLAASVDHLLSFLDLPYYPLQPPHLNRGHNQPHPPGAWSRAQKLAFERWCGEMMDRWYPDWREENPESHSPSPGQQSATVGQTCRSAWSHAMWFGSKALLRAKARAAGTG